MRWRPALSLGVIAALAVAVWAALASGEEETPTSTPTTTVAPATTSSRAPTTKVAPPTTATTIDTTSSTEAPDTTISPEARREEVRLILEDLWFRWFDAIYRNDEAAVREVIATEQALTDFRRSVESLDLPDAPTPEDISITDLEILRDDEECLVTNAVLDLRQWRGEGATTSEVDVLLKVDGEWRFGTAWTNPNDLWEQDCDIEPEL